MLLVACRFDTGWDISIEQIKRTHQDGVRLHHIIANLIMIGRKPAQTEWRNMIDGLYLKNARLMFRHDDEQTLS